MITEEQQAFVRARLDEDEAAAKAASWQYDHGDRWHVWGERSDRAWVIDDQGEEGFAIEHAAAADTESVARHIALNDPVRVLHEVEGWRKILSVWKGSLLVAGSSPLDPLTATAEALSMVCCAKAAVYSDHPDYGRLFG
jgi:hypothetical protein